MASSPVDEMALARSLRDQNRQLAAELESVKGGGGGGTSGPMEPAVPLKEYVDKADEAVESRLMAKLDTLATKAEISSSRDTIRNNIWGAVAAILAVLLGVMAFGGDRFDSGIGMADQRQAQLQRDHQQDASVQQINQKLDVLIASQPKAAPKQ